MCIFVAKVGYLQLKKLRKTGSGIVMDFGGFFIHFDADNVNIFKFQLNDK